MFSNLDIDPMETLRLAEVESTLWAETHVINNHRLAQEVQVRPDLGTTGRWCFTGGSWKDKDLFSGQGWFSTLPWFDGLLGARNIRACVTTRSRSIFKFEGNKS